MNVFERNLKLRIIYLLVVICIIVLGLLSRKISVIPAIAGDILWAIMIYFLMRFVFIHLDRKVIFCISLMFCYFIEISQLYQADWINNIRKTVIGSLVFGHGFLWSDILAYTVGTTIAVITEFLWRYKKKDKM